MQKVNQLPTRSTLRDAIYDVLDGERDYQEGRRAESNSPPHEIAAYITYMRNYLAEAETIASRVWGGDCNRLTLDSLRKVVTLGIACFEAHGVPPREFHVPASAGITGELHATAGDDFFAPGAKPEFAAQSAAAETLAAPLPSTPVPEVPAAS